MLPSLHDDFLVSYEVNCESRQIKLYAKRDPRIVESNGNQLRVVTFDGVEWYQFENDAFGNIIFALEEVPIERLLAENGQRIAESYRWAGAPGPWAADLASAAHTLAAKGIKGFVLSSSYGLSGWVLAKEVLVERV